MTFESLGLKAELLRAVSEKGYNTPTPIQRQAIPAILAGRDLMGGAQTGTGKTAGFTLPLLQRLMPLGRPKQGRRILRALVLVPTRELAAQVGESVSAYGKYLSLKSAVVFGGVKINPQIRAFEQGVDVLVATPGRLLDHIGQRSVDLSNIEILVLDEADRMLDMGFIKDIRKVLTLLPKNKQTLLFSATFSTEIKRLAGSILKSPALIEVARKTAASEQIAQLVRPVDKARKADLLSYLVGSNNWHQVLVFTRTKHGANRLTKKLIANGLKAAAIHGDKSQGARTRVLAEFKSGQLRVLVATDIAARGLDIDQLLHVVNFELPNVPEDYVHRIGRTGRAGHEGEAISLVSVDEIKLLRDIESLIKSTIPRVPVDGFEPDFDIKSEAPKSGRKKKPQAAGGKKKSAWKERRARGKGFNANPKKPAKPSSSRNRRRSKKPV